MRTCECKHVRHLCDYTLIIIFSLLIHYVLGASSNNGGTADSSQPTSSGPETTASQKVSSTPLLPLPGPSDTFDDIRNRDLPKLFIDKTSFIRKLIDDRNMPKLVMITRPKRFGKTTFLQMLRNFFGGKKEDFVGTNILPRGNGVEAAEKDGKWNPEPVIYINFEAIAVKGKEEKLIFYEELEKELRYIAGQFPNFPARIMASTNFNIRDLIRGMNEASGKRVVILIDNYDSPLIKLTNYPFDRDIVHGILETFYQQIRDEVNRVRFAFVVGLNVLNIVGHSHGRFYDLTMEPDFISMLGVSEAEMDTKLKPYVLERFVPENETLKDSKEISKYQDEKYLENKDMLKTWYGGHRFDTQGEFILNPSSVCAYCLRKGEFKEYMGRSQLISQIRERMRKEQTTMTDYEWIPIDRRQLEYQNYELENIPLPVLLKCTGYLSIVEYEPITKTVWLDYSNDEIRVNLARELPDDLIATAQRRRDTLIHCIERNNLERLIHFLNQLNYEKLSEPLKKGVNEFKSTHTIKTNLQAAGVKVDEGEKLIALDGFTKEDLDFRMETTKTEHVVSVKFRKSAIEALIQLIRYICQNRKAFETRVKPHVHKSTFLVGMNVRVKETKEYEIDEWVCVPYENSQIRVDKFTSSVGLNRGTFETGLNQSIMFDKFLEDDEKQLLVNTDKLIVWNTPVSVEKERILSPNNVRLQLANFWQTSHSSFPAKLTINDLIKIVFDIQAYPVKSINQQLQKYVKSTADLVPILNDLHDFIKNRSLKIRLTKVVNSLSPPKENT